MNNVDKQEAQVLADLNVDAKSREELEETGVGGPAIIKNKAGQPTDESGSTPNIEEIP